MEFLSQVCQAMTELLGRSPEVLAYPQGIYSELSEVILSQQGIYATVTIVPKINTIIKGLPQSLRQLGRLYMTETTTAQDLLSQLSAQDG